MTHEFYIASAYAVTVFVMSAISCRIWLSSRHYRQRVEALAPIRRQGNQAGR